MEADRARLHPALAGAARLSFTRALASFAAVLAGLPLLVACSAPAPAQAIQTVRGVLVDVESPSLQKVDSFTLRTDDGRDLFFTAAPNFNAAASHPMTPGHMRQHMALGDPVTVEYRVGDNGALIALNATD